VAEPSAGYGATSLDLAHVHMRRASNPTTPFWNDQAEPAVLRFKKRQLLEEPLLYPLS
jgi:hypothetical protein